MTVSIPGAIPNDYSTTATINHTSNDTYASSLGTNNDVDWWQIELIAGLSYDFTLFDLPNGSATMRLLSPMGQTLDSAAEGGTVSITPAAGGTYYISIADNQSWDSVPEGAYTFSARVDDTIAANTATTGRINGTGTTWGTLGQSNDSDWYRVSFREGLTYGFTLTGDGSANTLDDGWIEVRAADGTRLNYTDEDGTVNWSAATTGTYYVSVSDRSAYDDAAEGNFRITAAMSDSVRNDDETTARIIDGQRLGGRIDVYGDADWHGFNAVAGRSYTVRLSGDNSANELAIRTIRVYDANGRQITSDIDSFDGGAAVVSFTASATGRVYFSAESSAYNYSGGRAQGGYFLQVVSDATVVNGTSAAEHLTAGDGNNRIYGQGGNDSVFGGLGDDLVSGGTGNDLVDGGAGNDRLRGEAGNDLFSGGAGRDAADFTGSRAVTINLSNTAAQNTGHGLDRFVSVEDVLGSSAADRITGNGRANTLSGGAGNDVLRGEGGADRLEGGAGNDRMIGGTGRDWAVFAGSAAATVDLRLTTAQSTGYGSDTLREIENVLSGAGRDRLIGNGGANVLDGGGAADRLIGGGGNDRLFGGSGHDTLSGGSGRDTLMGGTGDDVLTGGRGADRFIFERGMDVDRITDFRNDTDKLVLDGFGLYGTWQIADRITQSGRNVVIDLGEGDRVVVLNSTVAAVTDDILFSN